jgi:hypothetical protein
MAAAISLVMRLPYISIGVSADQNPKWAEKKATYFPSGSTVRSVRHSGPS